MPQRTSSAAGKPNSPQFTQRQGVVLAFIHAFIQRRGMAPSFEEIASHFGISSPSVNGMVKTLERRGLLSRVPGVARSLRVLVPAAQLPSGDFGARAPSRDVGAALSHRDAASVPPQDAATAAAIAVLDVLMPLIETTERKALVREAAEAVKAAFVPLVGDTSAKAVGATVDAEVARWSADGRGTVVPHRIWVKR